MKPQPREILGLVGVLRTLAPAQLVEIAQISHIPLRRSPDLYQFADIALADETIIRRLQHAPISVLEAVNNTSDPVPAELNAAVASLALGWYEPNSAELLPLEAASRLLPTLTAQAEALPEFIPISATRALQLADEILLELGHNHLPLTKHGHLLVAETKHLETIFGVSHTLVDAMCSVLVSAGIARARAGVLELGDVPSQWNSIQERGEILHRAWLAELPEALGQYLRTYPGSTLVDSLNTVFPLASSWRSDVAASAALSAAALGGTSTPDFTNHLAEVTAVYMQPDGSVIAPGPLTSTARAQVDLFAQLERLDDASTFRVTEQAIATALRAGHDSAEIQQAAVAVSATEVPGSISRLISETERKLTQITVTATASGTRIEAATEELAAVLAHDRMLKEFHLTSEGNILTTAIALSPVYQALVERRYIPPIRIMREPVPETEDSTLDLQLEAAKDLLESAATDNSVEAQLHLAIKLRIPVDLSMTLRNGDIQVFRVQPVNVANGRLAAVDPDAEVERTLPLDRISKLVFTSGTEGAAAR